MGRGYLQRGWIAWLPGLPPPLGYAIAGAACVGLIGGTVGLVVGIIVYWPTAPFAVVELGLPTVVLGGLAGLAAGCVVTLVRRSRRDDR